MKIEISQRTLERIFLLTILLLSFTHYTIGATTQTTGYYLETPPPSCDFFVGKYTNSSYYAINVTDYDNFIVSSTFETVMQPCLDAGGHIKLGSATFELSSAGLDIDQNPVKLEGSGVSQTIITTDGALNDHLIFVDGDADYSELTGFTLDGSGQGSSYHGIYAYADTGTLSGLWMYHLVIQDCGDDGIHLGTAGSYDQLTGKMHHLRIRNNGGDGIEFTEDATDWEVQDLLVSGHSGSGDAGLRIDSDNCRFSTGHLWGNYYEIDFCQTHDVSGWIFSNVGIMDGDPQIGRHRVRHSGTNYLREITFVGCEFWVAKLSGSGQQYDGMYFTGNTMAITVTGNVFLGRYWDVGEGAYLKDSNYAINWDASVDNCTIVGNVFRGFNRSDPILVTGSHITESANCFYDNG